MKFPSLSISPDRKEQQVPDGWQTARQSDFRGGENLSGLPETIGRNQFIRMENCMISLEGWVTDSCQMDQFFANQADFTGVFEGLAIAPYSGGFTDTTKFAAYWRNSVTGNMMLGYFFGSTMALTVVTEFNPFTTTINGLSFAVPFLGFFYTVNGAGGLIKLDVSTPTKITGGGLTGKTPVKLRRYANRLWVINSDGSMQCCNNGDATTWDVLNIFYLPNQDHIADFFPVQGGAIVHSKSAIYPMYGSDYTDLSFGVGSGQPLIDNIRIAASVRAENTVYFLTDQGIFRGGMNGVELIPHNQQSFFDENWEWFFNTNFYTESSFVSAAYIKRFNALLFMCQSGKGTQGFFYYIKNNAFTKINETLPASYPYLLSLNLPAADFILSTSDASIAKSTHPLGSLVTNRTSVFQTRHEDADSLRDKVWRELVIDAEDTVYNITVYASLDYGAPVMIDDSKDLEPGLNYIQLFGSDGNALQSKTISLIFEINAIVGAMKDETTGYYLRDDDGDWLTAEGVTTTDPAAFTIKGVELRYRETGPEI